jgi:hypothetical protein
MVLSVLSVRSIPVVRDVLDLLFREYDAANLESFCSLVGGHYRVRRHQIVR